MKTDTDLIARPGLEMPRAQGIYLQADPSELASRLFAMSVDLATVLDRLKARFRTETTAFVQQVHQSKQRLRFDPYVVSTPVYEDQPSGGMGALLPGLFGYERRVQTTRMVTTKQLDTRDIHEQLKVFVTEAITDFETRVLPIPDAESVFRQCVELSTDHLRQSETTILKATIRRIFSKISVKQWQLRLEPTPTALLTEDGEIRAASEDAYRLLERMTYTMIGKAQASRRKFEQDIDAAISQLSEELMRACVDREQIEQFLKRALDDTAIAAAALHSPLIAPDGGLRVVSPLGTSWRRALTS